MLESLKTYIVGEWKVIRHAPASILMIAAVVGLALWNVINWSYGAVVTNQTSEIRLLERQVKDYEHQVDRLQKRPATTVGGEMADTADLVLRTYGDERIPTRLSYENVWRWYYLRMIMVGIEIGTGKEHRNAIANLFITFDRPVKVGTLEVSSQDFALPSYEVKEFTNRYAIITFTREVPEGTIHVRIYN